MMKKYMGSGLISLFALSQTAPLAAHVSNELQEACKSHSYSRLHHALQKKSDNPDSTELKSLAHHYHDTRLLHAVEAFDSIDSKRNRKIFTKKEFLQTALFIEYKLPGQAKENKDYLNKTKTDLPLSIDYDPEKKKAFIQLEHRSGAQLGEGAFKKVTKAIQYGRRAEIVAKASLSGRKAKKLRKMDQELGLTKKVHGMPGIFDTKGFTAHRKPGGKKTISIYSKLYNAGSLQDVFDEKIKFSKWEKARIANSLISGLASLQAKGIAHRDLGCRNYLVNIPEGKRGRRHIDAVIADLGCSDYAKNSVHYKVQGNTSYTSPEGLFRRRMSRDDYYKSDVFALGNVLYQLINGEPPAWQDHYWVKGKDLPLRIRYHEMVTCIHEHTKQRIDKLEYKEHHGSISRMKELELLVLRMCNPNPKKRPSAQSLKQKMQKIFARF